MMSSFGLRVTFESGQSAICGAIGMAHQEYSVRAVQLYREPHLLKDKIPLEVISWRGQCLRSPGDHDHVGLQNPVSLQEFVDCQTYALIEATQHGSISNVSFRR